MHWYWYPLIGFLLEHIVQKEFLWKENFKSKSSNSSFSVSIILSSSFTLHIGQFISSFWFNSDSAHPIKQFVWMLVPHFYLQ